MAQFAELDARNFVTRTDQMRAVDRTENALMPSGPYLHYPLGEHWPWSHDEV
jgi:hypothetical protein